MCILKAGKYKDECVSSILMGHKYKWTTLASELFDAWYKKLSKLKGPFDNETKGDTDIQHDF